MSSSHWSALRLTHGHPATPAAVPSWFTWRRKVGFVEQRGELGASASPLSPAVGEWLCGLDPTLALHLVLEVGGAAASTAWVGLSAVNTSATTREALTEASADLSEVLDIDGLFGDRCLRGPGLEGPVLHLRPVDDRAPREDEDGPPWSMSLGMIGTLAKRPHRLALQYTLRAIATPADLRADIESAQWKLGTGHFDPMAAFFDPAARQRIQLQHRIDALRRQANTCGAQVQLFGLPPRAILRSSLERRLTIDLGRPVAFGEAPGPALTLAPRAMTSILSMLETGGAEASGASRARPTLDDPDAIPF